MVFVDTGAWFALLVSADMDHAAAADWRTRNDAETLVTTDYVLDELLTLLRMRNQEPIAQHAGQAILDRSVCDLIFLTPADIAAAWDVFTHFADKHWSFTDCTSYAVMQRLRIDRAFAFDDHFRQFGTVQVLPADF